MLVALEDLEGVLACPSCRTHLEWRDGRPRCPTSSCPLGAPDGFPVVGRWPVILDPARSIVDPEELADPAPNGRAAAPSRVSLLLRRAAARWLKPPNRVAARNVEALLGFVDRSTPTVLVVGGGSVGNGVEALYRDQRIKLVAFDIAPSEHVQFIADAHQIPLPDASVDAVVIQAVLEHVLDPSLVVSEIHRVLEPDGLVYAETPFLQQVHAGPYDFQRFTSSGHRFLFRAFGEIDAGPVAGPGTQLLWSIEHLVRGLSRSQLAGRLARAAFFWLRLLDRVVPDHFAMDDASAYYFLGRRAGEELTHREIVDYYRGAQRHTSRSDT